MNRLIVDLTVGDGVNLLERLAHANRLLARHARFVPLLVRVEVVATDSERPDEIGQRLALKGALRACGLSANWPTPPAPATQANGKPTSKARRRRPRRCAGERHGKALDPAA